MIKFARKKWSRDELLGLFDKVIADWFASKYKDITEPQAYGVPLIHRGKNVLVSSPTGSGKTLTAFISIINELFLLAKNGELEDKIYCVYISPLKALANDIHRNLEVPLKEINEIAKKEKMEIPKIRVGVRSGDTSQSERQKMLRKPPHIFITTPESLALVLTAPKFREKFRGVRYVIVDEIHEVANNKRGVLLSLNLERLANLAGEFQRIGLSATQAPLDEIARFLGGYRDGKERNVTIVQSESRKKLDLKVITPVEDLTLTPYEVATEKMYDILVDMIKKHRTTLIFTNTRSGTEHVAYKLKERGIENIEAHHGSLSKETRLRVEKDLKEGRLKCVISSTSLELGIDIGYIDLVVQIGSPKSVAKGLQRIGRSGHAFGKVAKGRFMVFELDDLVECATLVKCAYEGKIDRIRIPENSLDVLAQTLVGMSLEKRWDVEEAYKLVKNSYCYRNLPREKFIEVLRYLGGKVMGDEIYSKLWFDEEEGKFGRKRTSRMIYFMNMGTIPDEADYIVVDLEGKRLGDLSEKFVEKLQRGDVFVLGARSYEVMKISHSKVIVRDATGKRPTVPSWAGEMLPRSFDLSVEVGKFREFVKEKIEKHGEKKAIEVLIKEYYLDEKGARSIVSYVKEQMNHVVPTDKRVLLEGYMDSSKRYNIIFHFPFGRRVNDALSRAYAYKISENFGVNVGISITDDAFMLTSKKKIPIHRIKSLLISEELENVLKDAVFNTELFKQRFRHVATRSFMVLRRYKGKSVSVARQQLRSDRILKILRDIENFPVMEETFNEIFNIAMDMPNAKKILEGIEKGEIDVKIINYSDAPSIFAHSIILVGISDIVLMEDRSALLKELHLKLLERIIPSEEIENVFTEEELKEYFESKLRIRSEEDILKFMAHAPGADVIHRRGINVFDYSDMEEEQLRNAIEKLIDEGKIVSVYSVRLLWTSASLLPVFSTVYAKECDENIDWEGDKTADEIAKEKKMKKSEVIEILKCMEKAYRAGRKIRGDKILWYRREKVEINRDYALEILIKNLLYFRAPLTFEEIIYTLRIDEDDARRILKYMVEEGTVTKGKFLVGYGEQYMLTEDYEKLKKGTGISLDDLQWHRASKIIRKMSCDEYFSKFLVVFNVDSLKVRSCFEEFLNMVKEGEIAYGRFMGQRFCYARKRDIPIFAGAYRKEELDDKDRRILNLIAALGEEAKAEKIEKMSNYTPGEVKKIIRKLEKNIYIYRDVDEKMNLEDFPYRAVVYEKQGDEENLAVRVLRGYGPLNREELEWYTSLNIPKNAKKLNVEGRTYYYAGEEIEKREVREIVPKEDPFSYPILHSLYDSFPEVKSHILVENGKVIATGDIEDNLDHYSVGEISGKVKEFLEVLKNRGVVISPLKVRVKGYRKIGDYYVSGDISKKIYPKKKLLSYLLWKNRVIPGRKLKTPLDVVKFLMLAHSDFEMLRAYKRIELDKYYHSELIYEIVDLNGQRAYGTRDTASLFQAIKSIPMDKNMKAVYEMIREKKKMSLREIEEESPLGVERTQRALKALFEGNYIVRYSSGYAFVEKKYTQDYGKQKFVENLINIFGFLNVNLVKKFAGAYISPREIILVFSLSSLTPGLYLNDGKIYYVNEEEIDECEEFEIPIALDAKDPLAILITSIFPQKMQGFVVIKGENIGVVKASIKRKVKISKSSSPEAEQIFREALNL